MTGFDGCTSPVLVCGFGSGGPAQAGGGAEAAGLFDPEAGGPLDITADDIDPLLAST